MNTGFKAIIVDDEPGARSLLSSYLDEFHEIQMVAECNTGEKAIKTIDKYNPDLVFLDIQMPNMDGFEVLKNISAPFPLIIFVTAFDEFAIRAFEVSAFDYLLKPFDKSRFNKSVTKALKALRDKDRISETKKLTQLLESFSPNQKTEYKIRLTVKEKSKSVFIPVEDIECIEGYDNYSKIHTSEAMKLGNYTLKEIESILDPVLFTRVHKSFIVNKKKIKAIEPFTHGEYILYLAGGKEVKLSRTFKDKLEEIIG